MPDAPYPPPHHRALLRHAADQVTAGGSSANASDSAGALAGRRGSGRQQAHRRLPQPRQRRAAGLADHDAGPSRAWRCGPLATSRSRGHVWVETRVQSRRVRPDVVAACVRNPAVQPPAGCPAGAKQVTPASAEPFHEGTCSERWLLLQGGRVGRDRSSGRHGRPGRSAPVDPTLTDQKSRVSGRPAVRVRQDAGTCTEATELPGPMLAQRLWRGMSLNRWSRNVCACAKNGVPASEWLSLL